MDVLLWEESFTTIVTYFVNRMAYECFQCSQLLTQSLNKGQKNQTMVRELSMVQVAYVGPYQAQLTHIQYWGHWSPC